LITIPLKKIQNVDTIFISRQWHGQAIQKTKVSSGPFRKAYNSRTESRAPIKSNNPHPVGGKGMATEGGADVVASEKTNTTREVIAKVNLIGKSNCGLPYHTLEL